MASLRTFVRYRGELGGADWHTVESAIVAMKDEMNRTWQDGVPDDDDVLSTYLAICGRTKEYLDFPHVMAVCR